MISIKRVLVCLDLTDHDFSLINYVSRVSKIGDVDTIYFVHITEDLDLPEDLKKTYPDLIAPMDETLRNKINSNIEKYGSISESTQYEVIIDDGNRKKEILKLASRKNVDLLVVGRKPNTETGLAFVRNIVRLAPCSVSVIPMDIPKEIERIVVAIDFSENSAISLQLAGFIASNFEKVRILVLNIYNVPSGFSKTGKSYDEFSAIMKDNAEKEYNNFLKQYEIDIPELELELIDQKDEKIPDIIYDYANKKFADAIVLGSKGRSAFSSVLMGSIAETTIPIDRNLPLIIVKNKKEAMGLLDVIKLI